MSGIDAIHHHPRAIPGGPDHRNEDLPRRCSTRAPQVGVHSYVLKGLLRREPLETIPAAHAEEERIPEVAAQITKDCGSPL